MEYLRDKGWDVTGVTRRPSCSGSSGIAARPIADDYDPLGEIVYVSGRLGG